MNKSELIKSLNLSNAYELINTQDLKDVRSEGVQLFHKKSGAKIALLLNDDENKVFFIAFRTPPKDSTGAAHIVEHTVLCGSRKYPLKDPFIELAKGSLNTFLNAMTYPDKTVYPVASCNDQDFKNLMDVYMDSVFYPNIYREEKIFRQEGWHYELGRAEDDIIINGVVYNEMKGAFSSPENILERQILSSLYPDTPYAFESGGDPESIPDLSYERFLDFHRVYYHPSNSYIYLYGDMNMAERLEWLDAEYLSHFNALNVDSHITMQPPFEFPLKKNIYYPISEEESESNRSLLSCAWSVGCNPDLKLSLSFEMLSHALIHSQGAPLKQALIRSGICEDVYGGYEDEILQPSFSVVAKNSDPKYQERFLSIIEEVLTRQAEEGIGKKTLLSAANRSEFAFREADYGRLPKGLVYGLMILGSWLYDEKIPFLRLNALSVYRELKEKIKSDYFENLIRVFLLGNPHRVILQLSPKKGLNEERKRALSGHLCNLKRSLGDAGIEAMINESRNLTAYQAEPSSAKDLEKIPLLSRDDIKKTGIPYRNREIDIGDLSCLQHTYAANGIIYLDMLFDIHHIGIDDAPFIGILKTLLGKLDTEEYDYADLCDEINLNTGGIGTEIITCALANEEDKYQAKLAVSIRVLKENLSTAIALAKSIILHTRFDDDERVREVLTQTKASLLSEIRENGHIVSASRALASATGRASFADAVGGMGYYRLLETITDDFDVYKEKLKGKMISLMSELIQPGSLMLSCTCDEEDIEILKNQAAHITEGLHPDTLKEYAQVLPSIKNDEGLTDASAILYVSLGTRLDWAGGVSPYSGVFRVFRTLMNYDYLWQNVRVIGGAYGCGVSAARSGEFYLYSYRDPNLKDTLDTYRKIADFLEKFEADEKEMTRLVIGTFSEIDAPLTPAALGRRSLIAALSKLSEEQTQSEREQALSVSARDIRALAPLLRSAIEDGSVCVIGNETKIKECAEIFDITSPLCRV